MEEMEKPILQGKSEMEGTTPPARWGGKVGGRRAGKRMESGCESGCGSFEQLQPPIGFMWFGILNMYHLE